MRAIAGRLSTRLGFAAPRPIFHSRSAFRQLSAKPMADVGKIDNAHSPQIPTQIISIKRETKTVKSLMLSLIDRKKHSLKFLPGQWIDFKREGIPKLGGYSIVSTPEDLYIRGFLEIAAKQTEVEPTKWIHTQAALGDIVNVRVGGEFCFDMDSGEHMILVAGGIGVTPFMSILGHYHQVHKNTHLSLIYSVRDEEEIVFYRRLLQLSNSPRIKVHFTITGDATDEWEGRKGRVDEELLSEISNDFKQFESNQKRFLVSGPHEMIDDVEKMISKLGVSEDKIHSEKW